MVLTLGKQANLTDTKMNESNLRTDKLKDQRRFSQEQYDMLKCCSDKKDMTEWNEWRNHNPAQDVLLEGADLKDCWLRGVLLNTKGSSHFSGEVHLEGAILTRAHLIDANFECSRMESAQLYAADLTRGRFWLAHLEKAFLNDSCLEEAQLNSAYLKGAILYHARVKGARFSAAIIDSGTSLWGLKVNRQNGNRKGTNFTGVGLENVRIDPGTKQLLEYNIRRMNWEDWYKEHFWLKWLVKPFWWISDYGLRTWRTIVTFFLLAFLFALIYWLWPNCVMVNREVGDVRGLWQALYFSVVTMTTLGFGDIAANPDSWAGQTLLMIQVILGYVLLGALVTRFAVLFTAGGPAGKFADEKEKEDKKK